MLGLVLANYLGNQIHERTLHSSVQAADLTVRLGIEPHLTRDALSHGLPAAQAQALDDAVRGLAPGDLHVARIQIWNEQRKIVYSTDSALIGHGAQGKPSPELSRALQGATASEVISDRGDVEKQNRALVRRFGELLEVYTPIRAQGSRAPVGAFELYIPYAPGRGRDRARHPPALPRARDRAHGALRRPLPAGGQRVARAATARRGAAKEHAERSAHDATHDPLTSLPNRSLFRDRAHQAILASARHGHNTALLLIDLDRFKEINDTLGHHSGDLLLREVGPRLHRVLRESDTVARFGGDEFGILLTHVSGPERGRGGRPRGAPGARGAVRDPGADARRRGVDRDRAPPAARVRLRGADAAGRRRDVPRQGQAVGLRGLRPERGRVRRHQAEAGERAAAGAAPQRARHALPAEGRPAHGPHRRRRGAHALAPSPARGDDARPVHPARRAQRAHPLAHPLRRPDGAHPGPHLARGGDGAHGVGQPLDARPDRRLAPGRDRRAPRRDARARRTCSSSRSPRASSWPTRCGPAGSCRACATWA